MKHTGFTPHGNPLWTSQEIAILRKLFPDYDMIKKALRRRTRGSIEHKARKLGLAKKLHVWTAAGVSRLRRMYPQSSKEEILAAFPGFRWAQITNQVQYLKLHKKRRPYKSTGDSSLDELRSQCFKLGYSMTDLGFDGSDGALLPQREVALPSRTRGSAALS